MIHRSDGFIAVIDGATSKSAIRWSGERSGWAAARCLDAALGALPADCSAREAVDRLSAAIRDVYRREDRLADLEVHPHRRLTASLVICSRQRRELWFIGDCQALLNGELICYPKEVDHIVTGARALFLELQLLQGSSVDALRENDRGREYILPLLKQQALLQNHPGGGPLWFPVIDGFAVPDEGIRIRPLPPGEVMLVLASDGYPVLKDSLAASEAALRALLQEDPLLFRKFRATKGVAPGYISFDDRSYIKFKLQSQD